MNNYTKENHKVIRYSIDDFLNSESIMYNSLSYKGDKVLYSSDRTGVYNAFSVSIQDKVIKQLTASTENNVFPVSYFPNDDRFLYLSDKGGNEIFHLYVCDEKGEVTELTTDEKERAIFYSWSQDGQSFFYGSNKRDPRFMDVYEMNSKTFESRVLFEDKEGYEFGAISPDKKFIALSKVINSNHSTLYLYDVETGESKCVSKGDGEFQSQPQTFSQDSKELYYLTDEGYEFLYLKKLDTETGEEQVVAKEDWDIMNARFSKQFTYLLYSTNVDARTEISILDMRSGQKVQLKDVPVGQITSIKVSQDEKTIIFLLNSPTSPNNLYAYNLESQEMKQLTSTLNPSIDESDLVEAEVIRYSSFDGLEIPAIYYKPHLANGEKAPALVFVHGGPGGQSRLDYNLQFQYLANQGYAILAVNNRGSSGYGKTFFKAADLKHGEIDLADCVEGKTYLQTLDHIDADRIGIFGGSYGGYMVLAALAFRPDEFKVGVDIFGVSNWERTLKSIPSWWESFRDALYQKLGNPYTQTDYIRSISPLFHADKITKPLIVLQGANDPRVLKVESDEIVEILEKNQVPVEYIVFDDEGHGFTKRENRKRGYEGIVKFLDRYLR